MCIPPSATAGAAPLDLRSLAKPSVGAFLARLPDGTAALGSRSADVVARLLEVGTVAERVGPAPLDLRAAADWVREARAAWYASTASSQFHRSSAS
jgi:hypothetical protein